MNTKTLIFFKCILLVLAFQISKAQDYQFTQNNSSMFISPSYAGINKGHRISTNYRQSANFSSFVTYALSYDLYLDKYNSGVGVQLIRDQTSSGVYGLTDLGLFYSHNVKIKGEWNVRPGISFKYSRINIKFFDLVFNDQLNLNGNAVTSIEIPPLGNKANLDAAASVLFYSDKLWFGLTADNLLRPNMSLTGSDSKVPIKFMLLSGTIFNLNAGTDSTLGERIIISAVYTAQDINSQLDIKAFWNREHLILGIGYKGFPIRKEFPHNQYFDAAMMIAGLRLKKLDISYSFDFGNISYLNYHELSLIFSFDKFSIK
jgi:type IX secretion system PorP/SprF family membrane protein